MPTYMLKGIDASGKAVRVSVMADSLSKAAALAKGDGLTQVSVVDICADVAEAVEPVRGDVAILRRNSEEKRLNRNRSMAIVCFFPSVFFALAGAGAAREAGPIATGIMWAGILAALACVAWWGRSVAAGFRNKA